MRTTAVLLLSIIAITINAQAMEPIYKTVTSLFVASDNHEWQHLEAIFADEVELDYSSMNGHAAVLLSPKQITESWKSILPGFSHTHHQIGNFITEVNGNKAKASCYGTASHYLEDEGGNVWTVVGTYDFELIKLGESWRITKMKFNYKYQDGNTGLPAKVMEIQRQ